MTSEWFPGKGRDADDEAFLAELRGCAETRGLVDANPEDTTLHVWEHTLIVLVAVPGLQDLTEKPTLEVICDPHSGPPSMMVGCETDGYVADAYEELDLAGAELTPPGLARSAFGWFDAQLRRPMEKAIWRSWWRERCVVRFADTGEPVWERLDHRLRGRPPASVVRLR